MEEKQVVRTVGTGSNRLTEEQAECTMISALAMLGETPTHIPQDTAGKSRSEREFDKGPRANYTASPLQHAAYPAVSFSQPSVYMTSQREVLDEDWNGAMASLFSYDQVIQACTDRSVERHNQSTTENSQVPRNPFHREEEADHHWEWREPSGKSDAGVNNTETSNTTSRSKQPIIDNPSECDILYGRGKQYRHHPGNKRMKLIIDLHREAYSKADRKDKTYITTSIVKMIKSSSDNKSGRFLKFDKSANGWIEVSDEAAREKVGHAMRDGKTRPLEQIDPKELDDIPMVSDAMRQAVLHSCRLAASRPPGTGSFDMTFASNDTKGGKEADRQSKPSPSSYMDQLEPDAVAGQKAATGDKAARESA